MSVHNSESYTKKCIMYKVVGAETRCLQFWYNAEQNTEACAICAVMPFFSIKVKGKKREGGNGQSKVIEE